MQGQVIKQLDRKNEGGLKLEHTGQDQIRKNNRIQLKANLGVFSLVWALA